MTLYLMKTVRITQRARTVFNLFLYSSFHYVIFPIHLFTYCLTQSSLRTAFLFRFQKVLEGFVSVGTEGVEYSFKLKVFYTAILLKRTTTTVTTETVKYLNHGKQQCFMIILKNAKLNLKSSFMSTTGKQTKYDTNFKIAGVVQSYTTYLNWADYNY